GEQGYDRALLVVPRASAGGAALAQRRGGQLDHSEHAMVLTGEPAGAPVDPRLVLRPAEESDLPTVLRILEDAFDWTPPDLADRIRKDRDQSVVIEYDGNLVGTARLSRHGDVGAVHGFAIDPPF